MVVSYFYIIPYMDVVNPRITDVPTGMHANADVPSHQIPTYRYGISYLLYLVYGAGWQLAVF